MDPTTSPHELIKLSPIDLMRSLPTTHLVDIAIQEMNLIQNVIDSHQKEIDDLTRIFERLNSRISDATLRANELKRTCLELLEKSKMTPKERPATSSTADSVISTLNSLDRNLYTIPRSIPSENLYIVSKEKPKMVLGFDGKIFPHAFVI
jgi:hypothetical protein